MQGASDHLVSEAIYLADPEGNGIEIYWDRPSENWSWKNGMVEMATLRLDLEALAASVRSRAWSGLPAGSSIGHVHLQVGALDASDDFYAGKLGLDSTSRVGSYFTGPTAPGVIMSYAELLFLKSEFAYKGIAAAGDVAKNYTDAITASFAQYKLTVSPEYLTANALKAGAAGFTQIMEQKWIALYGQGLEAWTEFRRTGIPDLKPPVLNTNQNVIPTRLPYPNSEESLNYENFSAALTAQGGKNDMKMKLWFAK